MPVNPACNLPDLSGCLVDDGRLQLVNIVGAGAYGKIYKALDTASAIDKPNTSLDALFQERERGLHESVSSHPNILTLHRTFFDPHHVFMAVDLCAGDLFHAILDGARWNIAIISPSTTAILKPENILFNNVGDLLLADFGLATQSATSMDMDCGSAAYMSPESFGSASSAYSPQQNDLWALCIILINIVTAMNPWASPQLSDRRWESFIADPQFLLEILPISRDLNNLLQRCFQLDPDARPSLEQLRYEVPALESLFMSDEDLAMASLGVQRAAGFITEEPAYDPDDTSFCDTPSSSGRGYSSVSESLPVHISFARMPDVTRPRPSKLKRLMRRLNLWRK
ncbi:kinase-like protein [Mycena rebaudengoi]|nr:kinase-like protein [Mycena rebaudengoi]